MSNHGQLDPDPNAEHRAAFHADIESLEWYARMDERVRVRIRITAIAGELYDAGELDAHDVLLSLVERLQREDG